MRNLLLVPALFCFLSALGQAKKVKLEPVPIQIESFAFGKVTVIDTRTDTNVVGWVTKGVDNILVPAVFEESPSLALNRYFQTLTGHLWAQGKPELVVHVTDLFLYEDPDLLGTVGNVDVRIQAFVKKEDRYHPVYKTDIQEPIVAFDVTKKLFKSVNTFFTDFMKAANAAALRGLTDTAYSWEQVLALRQIELMEEHALFRNAAVKEGIYETAEQFHAQEPFKAVQELDQLISDNLAKPMKKRLDLFAYCKEGKIFFFHDSRKYETSEVYRRGDNFFKQAYGLDPELQASSAAAGWTLGPLFELVGTAANNGNRKWYEFIYNPRNSLFYHYRKLADTREKYQAESLATSAQ